MTDEKKIKKTLDLKRRPMPKQDHLERVKNFEEVALGYAVEMAREEASRCLNCKNPLCNKGCPVGIDIPSFIKCIIESDFSSGIRKIKETNALPAICGRVCPQEEQCEKLCVLGKKGEPVSIGRLERFLADWEAAQGKIEIPQMAPKTGKKVAIVGAGPAGVTVANDLLILGHDVTIFEALHECGGVLIYGIPEFRLPKSIVSREVEYVKRLGAKIQMDYIVGTTRTVDELLEEFDALFVGAGAGLPFDDIGLQTVAVGNVVDPDFLVGDEVGRVHQAAVDGDASLVVDVRGGHGGSVDLRFTD